MYASPRILLSEASSLSAREIITTLGLAGHCVEVLTSRRLCLGRFSKFVRRVHRVPPSFEDASEYLTAVVDVVKSRQIDVLIPTHEQAYLFAAARHRFPPGLGLALADFDAFEEVQNKARFSALLYRLGIPQASTLVVHSAKALAERPYPYFVKTVFGTASAGVWRVENEAQRERLATTLEERDEFPKGVLLQEVVRGRLERTQTVFDRGRLVAWHAYRQIVEGPRGGDVVKVSVREENIRELVERIGSATSWHGGLSFDYIVDADTEQPRFIDANPRLVEPMNAQLSGTSLTHALLSLSLGKTPAVQEDGRAGTVTKLSLMGLLDAAGRHGRRREVVTEAARLVRGSGKYRGAAEELTPFRIDPWSMLPVVLVFIALLVSPALSIRLSNKSVRAYSIGSVNVQRLRTETSAGQN